MGPLYGGLWLCTQLCVLLICVTGAVGVLHHKATLCGLPCGECHYGVCMKTLLTVPPPSSLPPSPLPAACLVLDRWRDRSLELALTENDEESSDELREDCEVKGDG